MIRIIVISEAFRKCKYLSNILYILKSRNVYRILSKAYQNKIGAISRC